MTDPFRIEPPADGHGVPLVLDSPHSGTDYPADFRPAAPMEGLRRAEDTHVDELFGAGPAVGATLIAARFPRSYIDPNRSLLDIDATLLDAPWPGPAIPSRKTQLGVGLVFRLLDSGAPIYDRKIGVAELKERIVRYHQPYQKAVKDALDRVHAHFGAVWHINCHSMSAVSNQVSEEGPGKARADFVLGDRDGTTCEPEFTRFVERTLGDMGYDVKVNDPYKGVELVRAFSDPALQRHSLQLEINRRLYMDEATRAKSAGFARLKADLDKLLAAVAAYASQRCAHVCGDGHGHHHDHHHHDHDHDHGHGHGHKHDDHDHA